MITLLYLVLCVCAMLLMPTVAASKFMIFAVLVITAVLFVTTQVTSTIFKGELAIFETLKIAMLTTVLLALSSLLTFQVMGKLWWLMYAAIPLYFLSIFFPIKSISGISSSAAATWTILNLVTLSITSKAIGLSMAITKT